MIEPLGTNKSDAEPPNGIRVRQKEEGLFFAEPEEKLLSHALVHQTERLKRGGEGLVVVEENSIDGDQNLGKFVPAQVMYHLPNYLSITRNNC